MDTSVPGIVAAGGSGAEIPHSHLAMGFAGVSTVSEGGRAAGAVIGPGDASFDAAFMLMGGYEEAEIPDGMGSLVGKTNAANCNTVTASISSALPPPPRPQHRHVSGNARGWHNSCFFAESCR
jgi:hypothetical protein